MPCSLVPVLTPAPVPTSRFGSHCYPGPYQNGSRAQEATSLYMRGLSSPCESCPSDIWRIKQAHLIIPTHQK